MNALEQQKPHCFGQHGTFEWGCKVCEVKLTCKEARLKMVGLSTTSINDCTPAELDASSQPAPKPNNHQATWALVISDMVNRNNIGVAKYGTPLQPFNGRNSLQDAYEEALDQAVYLKNAVIEADAINGILESEEFYNAMQCYRIAPMEDQRNVISHFENVKSLIRRGLWKSK